MNASPAQARCNFVQRLARRLIFVLACGALGVAGRGDEQSDLEEFADRLDLALGDMSWYGIGITERKARSVESNRAWFDEGMPVVGEEAPLSVRKKNFWVKCDKTTTRSDLGMTLSVFLSLGAKYFAEEGEIPLWLVRTSDLNFERFKDDYDYKWSWVQEEIAKTKAQLATLIPIAKFGDFGLFAGPQISAEQARDLEALVLKVNHPVLYSGINLTGMKVFEPLHVPGLSYPASGAAELAAAVAETSAQDGQRVVGVRTKADGQKEVLYAKSSPASEAVAEPNTIGPQLKGYDPKEADRPPPSREPPPPQIVGYVPHRGFTTGGEEVLRERERLAREKQAKPGPSMAAYAKQAERERAEITARRAKKAAEGDQVQIRLINERLARQKVVSDAWAKRREYVDAQANRTDAVMHGKIFVEGGWFKIPLRNRTDVSLWVTIEFTVSEKSGEQWRSNPTITTLFGLHSQDLILIAEEPGRRITDSQVSWKVIPGEYQNKVPVH